MLNLNKFAMQATLSMACLGGIFVSLADAAPKNSETPRQVSLHVGLCAANYVDFYGGAHWGATDSTSYIGRSPYYATGTISLIFLCHPVTDRAAFGVSRGGLYNPTTNRWSRDNNRAFNVFDQHLPPREALKAYKAIFHFGELQALNANGFYCIDDDTNGDPTRRESTFNAYLFYKNMVLQAYGRTGALNEPKKSLLPHMLRVLKTIEFIDTPAPPDSASAPVAP